MRFKELWGVTQIWTSFPEIGPAHAPEIEISKKYWMSFPTIRRVTAQKTEISEKIPVEFSRSFQ